MSDTTEQSVQNPAIPQTVCHRIAVLVKVIVGLMIMALLVNALLNLSSQIWPTWLPRRMSGTGFQKDITQRVQAAEQAIASDSALKSRKLCVFLGLSSQREAVDLATLARLDGVDANYLGLCGAGASMATMQQQSAALLASDLKPDLVVIGINLYHQVDPLVIAGLRQSDTPTEVQTGLPIVSPLLKGDVRQAYHQTRERIWVYDRRRDVSTTMTEKLSALNGAMLRIFGTTNNSESDTLTSPWREMIRIGGPEKASAATYASQLKSYANRGLFDASSYDPQHIAQEEKAVDAIISQLQARGSKVLIMLMPEHSSLRKSVPDVAMTRLKTHLGTTFGDQAPSIMDMREALSDAQFSDISHVNSDGRMAYSNLIASTLAKQMQ